MSKRHTTPKRKKDTPTTTRRHRYYFSNVVAKTGHRSFPTREAAEKWAKENGAKGLIIHETLAGKIQLRPKLRE